MITFPSHLGFTYSSSTATCSEILNLGSESNYVNAAPSCKFSTVDLNVLVTVTNLRTSGTLPPYYGLYFEGLTTGPA